MRSGDSGDSDGAETAGAPSKPLPGAAEPRPEGSAGSKAPSASGTGPEDAVHTPDPETAPEAAAAQQTDAAADTNTAPAGDTGSKAADPKADASREADTDPKAGASREADSGPKTAAGSTTAAGSQTDANPKAGAGHDADAGPKTGADPTTAADPQTDANPKAGAGHDADTDPKTAADPTTAADPQTDAGPKAGAGHDADAGPKTAADPQTDAGPKAGAGREAGGGVGTGAEAGGAATAEAEAAVIATHSVSGTRTDDETEAGTEDATGVDAPRASGAKAGADSAARAHDAVAADAASDSAGDGAKTDAEAGHGSASGAGAQADADAEGDAGVGGSRDAGGPGGRRSDDAGGGHGAGAQGVDQPTAVFKAVRVPADAPVDQPTTMLKLGGAGKPGTSETDAERTSRFVALKPLDDPATRRPPAAPADATARVPRLGPERTTQQPLPPKPPLDLLAELTNTPPPPQTPVRTIVRRVKIWTPLVVLLAVVFAVVQALRPLPTPSLDLTAEESYTFDGGKASIPWPSGGQGALEVQGIGSFGSSGEQKPVPIASVAKVMTAYLILRDHPLKGGEGPKIPVDQTAQDQATADGESTVEVRAGDTITEREALEGVLIASANNVARLLARWDAGSEKAFVAKMNAAAKDLGMTHTTYTDPSGLEKTTVSTAVDQVKLAKAAMQNASFREVARMMEYTDYKGTKHSNWNRLVGYNDVIGIKTGTTTAAGGNLVFAATREVGGETRTIVGAVVGQGPGGADNTIISGALDAGDKLIRAAQGALKPATILKKGDVVGYVDDGLGGRTPVVITKDVTAVGWAGLKVGLSFAADDVPHSAKAGTKVGTLTVGDGSNGAVKVPVALQKDLAEPGFTDKLTRLG
ncbi:D-alanyl-D-alanine carboxypeptidase [Streptomyces sp. NPDC004629]|uniref:D-alanyl-D-alanine carboxypeptidase n=1 Tax=Streptomyces sp. NPDC004629 TaxID=3364705 RepID=UPI0036AC95DE